jgi:hypothetical protein
MLRALARANPTDHAALAQARPRARPPRSRPMHCAAALRAEDNSSINGGVICGAGILCAVITYSLAGRGIRCSSTAVTRIRYRWSAAR